MTAQLIDTDTERAVRLFIDRIALKTTWLALISLEVGRVARIYPTATPMSPCFCAANTAVSCRPNWRWPTLPSMCSWIPE